MVFKSHIFIASISTALSLVTSLRAVGFSDGLPKVRESKATSKLRIIRKTEYFPSPLDDDDSGHLLSLLSARDNAKHFNV